MTDDDTMALLARVRWLEAEVQRLIEHAAQAEADRDTLAAEVRAWREADTIRILAGLPLATTLEESIVRLMRCGDTNSSGALTRAKEAK
jgi:hypothetical protein